MERHWKMDSESQDIPIHPWNVSKPSFEETCTEKQRFMQNVPVSHLTLTKISQEMMP